MKELVITPGSTGSIGSEVAARAIHKLHSHFDHVHVFGDSSEWHRTLETYNLSKPFASLKLTIHDQHPSVKDLCTRMGWVGGAASFSALIHALAFVAEKPQARALCTGPMKKSDFPSPGDGGVLGHTEILRAYFDVPEVSMCFLSASMKLIPLTRHIPLRHVTAHITESLLSQTYRNIEQSSSFIFGKPGKTLNIVHVGINPHAGEDGRIGSEDQERLVPFLNTMRNSGWNVEGPLSADSSVIETKRNSTDLYIANYHDQLLPVFKALNFGSSCQATLGLPIFRCSVDHGTAEDHYLKNRAHSGSMEYALTMASRFLTHA